MASKTVKRGGLSVGLALLLLAVLVVLNYLAARHFFHRFDLTENREFTVSPSTRKVLASLDDVVSVKAYFSKDLPERAATIPARVRDLLYYASAVGFFLTVTVWSVESRKWR